MSKKIEQIAWDYQRGDEAHYELLRAVERVGQPVFIVHNPDCKGMDTYGVIISNEIITEEELKELSWNIIKEDTFRSPGKGINETDDVVRATIDFTIQEFKFFKTGGATGPCSYPLLYANAIEDDEDTLCFQYPFGFNGPGELLE